MKKSFRRTLVLLIAIMMMATATLTVNAAGTTVAVKKNTARWVKTKGAYSELNRYRKKAKVKVIKKDLGLEKIAKIRAKEMAKYNKFSHTRPNGKSGLSLIKGNVYKGENIAVGFRTCASVTRAWYNSRGHRNNMLRKQFKKVGIACYEYNGVRYWVQMFSS